MVLPATTASTQLTRDAARTRPATCVLGATSRDRAVAAVADTIGTGFATTSTTGAMIWAPRVAAAAAAGDDQPVRKRLTTATDIGSAAAACAITPAVAAAIKAADATTNALSADINVQRLTWRDLEIASGVATQTTIVIGLSAADLSGASLGTPHL
jgi:hypothetical protein